MNQRERTLKIEQAVKSANTLYREKIIEAVKTQTNVRKTELHKAIRLLERKKSMMSSDDEIATIQYEIKQLRKEVTRHKVVASRELMRKAKDEICRKVADRFELSSRLISDIIGLNWSEIK